MPFCLVWINLSINTHHGIIFETQSIKHKLFTLFCPFTFCLYFYLHVSLSIRQGNGARWRRVLPFPSPYTLLPNTYLLPIPSGDEKLNLISVSDGFGYTCLIPIPAVDIFFNKNKSIFHSRSQFCNELSRIDMMAINGYGDREERGRECEIWKEIWENYDR